MKEKAGRGEGNSSNGETRRTLLRKYEIPVEHLDFRYVEKCNNVREIERILKILRSGEEGHFPELEGFTVKKLEELNPRSRLLRIELPILRSEYLNSEEKKSLEKDFLEWTNDIESGSDDDTGVEKNHDSKEIFSDGKRWINDKPGAGLLKDILPVEEVPIRGSNKETRTVSEKRECDYGNNDNQERIKSWEYDKWDKFDVDAELTKLDVGEMKREEWELATQKKRALKEQQEIIEKLMRNEKAENIELLVTSKNKLSNGNTKKQTRSNVNTVSDGRSLSEGRPDDLPGTSGGSGDFKVPHLEETVMSRIQTEVQPSTSGAAIAGRGRGGGNVEVSTGGQRSSGGRYRGTSGMSVKVPSFIEEIDDEVPVQLLKKKEAVKKRFKIHIEDLNVG